MEMAASSSSCGAIHPQKYNVFVSFRGEDTRESFTSHLYAALGKKKVHTFIDDKLERGDEISPALAKAIKESMVSVIIFSENYASSTWCLDELLQILECKEKDGQIVIPVFYRVYPSHVRKQKGNYAAAFAELEERFSNRMDKVHQWRAALTQVANLSGWNSMVTTPESKLVEVIVEDIFKKLNFKLSTSEVKGLVGIEKHIKQIEPLLHIASPDVRVIGIWGMGGIGKTTLAGALFNRLSYLFESSYFLANVSEESEKYGLNHLRNKLVSELLEEEKINMGSPCAELTFIRERLRLKKVLIVLDDVNCFDQLEILVGDLDQFGDGSRIIVTTRDVQVLRIVANYQVYNVVGLEFSDAYKLFCANAFKENSSIPYDYSALSKRVTSYAQGVPLALKILGSFLRSKSTEEWESAMDKLEQVPNMDIQNVLRISYDGLDDNQKDIFLDIACFFKGYAVDLVERILDACGFFPRIGISVLVDKCLIYNDYGTLWMHDLLQEMGREIVRQQSIKEPGERSRLWNTQDACHVRSQKKKNDAYHVLKRTSGTARVEGIFLNTYEIEEVNLSPEVFSKMHNLRLLNIYGFNEKKKWKLKFPQGLDYLPDALAYLCWDRFPLERLPSNFMPDNIVILKMPYSQLKQLWDGIQDLGKLREMDLSYSKQLTQIPDLSHASNLETLNLECCTSLLQLPWSIRDLDKLVYLNLRCCSKLRELPELPRNIKELDLGGTAIKKMHPSIESLDKLESLNLGNCKDLANLPSSTCNLKSLTHLNLSGCTSIDLFPSLPRFISSLDLSGTRIRAVPSSIDILSGLTGCSLKDCTSLESLPTSICNLKSLIYLILSGCSNLEHFPEIMEPMQLKSLDLNGSGIKELHSSIGNLTRLMSLNLDMCENLEVLPNSIYKLNCIQDLFIYGCPKLENFTTLSSSGTALMPALSNKRLLYPDITFLNCPKLDKEACAGIMAEAHNFWCMKGYGISFICRRICCPGNEIPNWFTYQSDGSSMNIQLPPNWNGSNFLGLALCITIEFHDFKVNQGLKILCNAWFKRNNGEHIGFGWKLEDWDADRYRGTTRIVNSDHVFLWYNDGILKDLKATNMNCFSSASFSFTRYGCSTIKKCGVSLLYAQDVREPVRDLTEIYDLISNASTSTKPMVGATKTKRSRDEFEASGTVIVISSDDEEDRRT